MIRSQSVSLFRVGHASSLGSFVFFAAIGIFAVACGGPEQPPVNTTVAVAAKPSPTMAAPESGSAAATATAVPTGALTPVVPEPAPKAIYEGFATPECVLYDAADDVYFVSNIQGKPTEEDGNGFISRVHPDDKEQKEMNFIPKASAAGGAPEAAPKVGAKVVEAKLNAPKGLALVGNDLWVADINVVRIFDKKTGSAKAVVAIEGSTFLNDLASDEKGNVYVSDSGLKLGASGFEPTGTDAVYKIDGKSRKVTTLAKNAHMNRPNGLIVNKDGVWVAPFNGSELYLLGPKGEMTKPSKLPTGGLDGALFFAKSGAYAVSSWEGKAVYVGKPGGDWKVAVKGVSSPADIGFDSKRNRLLVPIFTENKLLGFDSKLNGESPL
jgi:sugar lactone lactonase YvrE